MTYTLEGINKKLNLWVNQFDSYSEKALKALISMIYSEIYASYSGKVLNIRSGKTRNAIEQYIEKNKKEIVAAGIRISDKSKRRFIAFFNEVGTKFIPARPIWGPAQEKYNPQASKKILTEIMAGYGRQ